MTCNVMLFFTTEQLVKAPDQWKDKKDFPTFLRSKLHENGHPIIVSLDDERLNNLMSQFALYEVSDTVNVLSSMVVHAYCCSIYTRTSDTSTLSYTTFG